MSSLAIIPARGGSKGIPRKNAALLAGRPLVAHTIEQARLAPCVDRVVVSTDDPEIAAISRHYGAEVVWRPVEISGDTATTETALVHALNHLEQAEAYSPDLVVFLQCTSPIRRSGDIDRAVQTMLAAGADSLLSVVQSHSFLWHVVDGRVEPVNYDYRLRPRRQDRNPEYVENGSIYVFKPWVLRKFNNRLGGKIALYEMDIQSSIDVDTRWDFELCEWVMAHIHQSNSERSS